MNVIEGFLAECRNQAPNLTQIAILQKYSREDGYYYMTIEPHVSKIPVEKLEEFQKHLEVLIKQKKEGYFDKIA